MSLRISASFFISMPITPWPPASLLAEGVDRHPLDVIIFGNRDDDLLVGDEIFHLEFPFCCDDLRFSLRFVEFFELFELFFDDAAHQRFGSQDSSVVGDFLREVLCIRLRSFPFQGRSIGRGADRGQHWPVFRRRYKWPSIQFWHHRGSAEARMILTTSSRWSSALR